MQIILMLRGHERSTFKKQNLNNFVNKLYKLFGDSLCVYIHTWNYNEAHNSWRILSNRKNITKKNVINYFDYNKIKCIVDDEDCLKLHGAQDIFIGSMPIKNWKLMWAGQNKIIELISKEYLKCNPYIINMRIDYFDCYTTKKFKITEDSILEKCKTAINNYDKITFFFNSVEYDGIDNIIFGNMLQMRKLINQFHYKLDTFYKNYNFCFFHENIVYFEAQKLNNTFQNPDKFEYYLNIVTNQITNYISNK